MGRHPRPTVESPLPRNTKARVRRQLLNWYDRNKRDLPWRRRPPNAFAQWVAEVMLQQTRVGTVGPYYDRFLRRFPNLKTLASANQDQVLKLWEGLGYYRRALFLHQAAKLLCRRGQGVPRTAESLRGLPGVGTYTAAAVASIVFQEPVAAVDGNVARVLARLFGVNDDSRKGSTRAELQYLASELLSPTRPGDFNQAWMDLGSLVCTPRSPSCPICPLKSICITAKIRHNGALPTRNSRRARQPRKVRAAVAVFVHGRKLFVRRRPTGGLWSGLWEFPTVLCTGSQANCAVIRQLARQHRLDLRSRPRALGRIRHDLTHRRLTLHVYGVAARPSPDALKDRAARWVALPQFEQLSVSTAHRRVLGLVQEHNLVATSGH